MNRSSRILTWLIERRRLKTILQRMVTWLWQVDHLLILLHGLEADKRHFKVRFERSHLIILFKLLSLEPLLL